MKKIFMLAFLLAGNGLMAQHHEKANKPQMVHQSKDGSITLDASTGTATGTEIAYMPEWKAFGWFRADGKVEWELHVMKAGQYTAELEWSVSDEEAGKGFVLQAGSDELKGVVGKSGSWETFKKQEIGEIKLKGGKQKVVFKPSSNFGKGALLDLRGIVLVPKRK